MPLLTFVHQQKCEPAVEMTMRDAVDSGIIANEYVAYYVALTHELLVMVGIRPDRLRFRQHLPDERAHYATDCWDAEVYSERFGWVETVGIADRTNYDLHAHAAQSKTSMSVFIQYDTPKKIERRRIIPNMGVLGKQYRRKQRSSLPHLKQQHLPKKALT